MSDASQTFGRGDAARDDALRIDVYVRHACHLCSAMFDDLRYHLANRLARGEVILAAVDIDADESLAAKFGERVPALFVAGEHLCDYRIDFPLLESALAAHLPPPTPQRRR